MSNFASMSLPVPSAGSELHDVLDSSKLNTFIDCPRRFFFEYVLGWRQNRPNRHLTFGSAWHEGMEVLMRSQDGEKEGYTLDEIMEAYEAFCKVFNLVYGEKEEEGAGLLIVGADDQSIQLETGDGKSKENAFQALKQYARAYKKDRFRTLWVEVSGATPISDDQIIYFKLDSIVQTEDGIFSYEHKTTGRKTGAWMEKWALALQVGTYAHVLNQYYGDEASGIVINGAVLKKPRVDGSATNEFLRVPIKHSRDMMSLWMWEVHHIMTMLDWNMRMLEQCSPSDRIMQAFPRNPASCTKFGCGFPGLCDGVANPLRNCETPPFGYKVEFWDPRNRGGDDEGVAIPKETPTEKRVTVEGEGGLKFEATPGSGH